ncbi:MAG: GxxExxY protein [Pseudomonadota bacterium]
MVEKQTPKYVTGMMIYHQAHKEHEGINSAMSDVDGIAKSLVDCVFTVHKNLGPGLLESAYEACLIEEFMERGLKFEAQKPLKIQYKSKLVDVAYRLDLVVEDKILIELKSVEKILPIHEAQILSYLKLSEYKLGFLINFNNRLIKDGIKRYII